MTDVDLVVAPCTHQAARYAVERWHYSARLPVGKLLKIGVWEDDRYVGCTVFTWGARRLSSPYGLDMTECVELARVALRDHASPVTAIVARSLKVLRDTSPGIRLVVSFADPAAGHVGRIYQAGNWLYLGRTPPSKELNLNGLRLNRRAYTGVQFGTGSRAPVPVGARWRQVPGKHRYAYPLDRAMRRTLTPLAKRYPVEPLETVLE